MFIFLTGQNSCPANYSSQMRFADPIVCSQYIQCVDGRLEQRTCPSNLLFDRITKTCKPFGKAECHGNKPNIPISTSVPPSKTSRTEKTSKNELKTIQH